MFESDMKQQLFMFGKQKHEQIQSYQTTQKLKNNEPLLTIYPKMTNMMRQFASNRMLR